MPPIPPDMSGYLSPRVYDGKRMLSQTEVERHRLLKYRSILSQMRPEQLREVTADHGDEVAGEPGSYDNPNP